MVRLTALKTAESLHLPTETDRIVDAGIAKRDSACIRGRGTGRSGPHPGPGNGDGGRRLRGVHGLYGSELGRLGRHLRPGDDRLGWVDEPPRSPCQITRDNNELRQVQLFLQMALTAPLETWTSASAVPLMAVVIPVMHESQFEEEREPDGPPGRRREGAAGGG